VVPEQSEHRKEYWLSEAILLAIVTAVAYLGAFCYEFGYANFFGIPTHFIEISILKIIISLCLVAYFALLVLGTSSFLWMFLPKKYDKISSVALPVVLFFVLLLIMNIDIWIKVIFGATGFLMGGYMTATHQEKKGKRLFDRILEKTLGEKLASFVRKGTLFLILFITIAFSVGKGTASWGKKFMVLEDLPQTVVLRKYGEILICAPFDSETREIKGQFIIRRMPEMSKLRFSVQSVGPLKKAGSIIRNYMWKDLVVYIILPSFTMFVFIMIFTLYYVRLSKEDPTLTIQEKMKQSFGASWLWFMVTVIFLVRLHFKIQQAKEKAPTTVIQKVPKDIIP